MVLEEKNQTYYQYNKEKPEKAGFILGILFTLSIGLIPINLFSRGGFQVVDLAIVPLITYFLFTKFEITSQIKKQIFLILPFVIWSQFVILGYVIAYRYLKIIIPAINMLYVFFMLLGFTNAWVAILSRKAYRYIYIGLIISVICVFTFKGSYEWEGMRFSYSFNNPNQLGLFGVAFLGIVILLMKNKKDNNVGNKIYFILDMIFVILAHFWVLKSSSRGAVGGIIVADICLLKNMLTKDLFLPVAATVITGVCLLFFIQPEFIKERIEERGEKTITGAAVEDRIAHTIIEPLKALTGLKVLYGTGYVPMLAQSLIYSGSDPGMVRRLGKPINEVHETFLNTLWGYGVIGLMFFTVWIMKTVWAVRRVPNALWIFASLLPISLTHALVRSRVVWLIVSLMLALLSIQMAKEDNRDKILNASSQGISA